MKEISCDQGFTQDAKEIIVGPANDRPGAEIAQPIHHTGRSRISKPSKQQAIR